MDQLVNSEEISTATDESDKSINEDFEFEPYTLESLLKDLKKTPDGLKTGYVCLDNLTRISPEAMTIIAGRPSHGKTTFMLNLLLNMIEEYQDKTFAFFSYEESKRQLGVKLINILAKQEFNSDQNIHTLKQYIQGKCDIDNKRIENATTKFDKFAKNNRLFLIDKNYSIEELSEKINALNETLNIGTIFIDYIQKIKAKGDHNTRQEELQEVSGQIVETAKANSIPIILGAQLRRSNTKSENISLDNIRECGDIEQDTNLALGILNKSMSREENNNKITDFKVKIMKNRNGQSGNIFDFKFNQPILTIEEKEE